MCELVGVAVQIKSDYRTSVFLLAFAHLDITETEDAAYKNKNGVESPNIVALDLTKSSTTDFVDSTKINNKTFDYDTEDLNCVTYIKNGKLQRYVKYIDENGRVKKN